jgi:regulator of protease activity HflC (stomatin/prohibitin superfamily)
MDKEVSNSNKPSQAKAKKKLTERYTGWASRWGPRILILLFVLIFVLILNFHRMFIFIQPGENGVLYRRFVGTDLAYRYTEGLTVILPWNKMYIYDTRDQEKSETFNVLAKNGLMLEIEISIRYRPRRGTLPLLHVTLGPDYATKVVIPEIKGKLRYLMGQYTPDEIYRSQGLLVRRAVETAAPELEEKLIVLDDLLLTKIELPQRLKDAIEKKLEQEQSYLEYEFRLAREQQEHLRKEIEAKGIMDFQSIIETNSGSSFANYLTQLGIEATLALATSSNAKVVVVGGGDNGLPLILNLPGNDLQGTLPPQNLNTNNSSALNNKGTNHLSQTKTKIHSLETTSLQDMADRAFSKMKNTQSILETKNP